MSKLISLSINGVSKFTFVLFICRLCHYRCMSQNSVGISLKLSAVCPQGLQGATSPFLGGTNFQNSFASFRENPDVSARTAVSETSKASSTPNVAPPRAAKWPPRSLSVPPPPGAPNAVRRRWPQAKRRRPQRRGFLDTLRGLGRRKKRDVFDDLLSGLTSTRFLGYVIEAK